MSVCVVTRLRKSFWERLRTKFSDALFEGVVVVDVEGLYD